METPRGIRSWWMPLLLSVYALNTAYLASSASPTLFYFGNVVFHIVAGIVLVIVWMWGREHRWARRPKPAPYMIASVVLGIGVAFGLLITIVGAAGRWRWL